MASIGKIIGVNGNLIRVKFESAVSQNEVAYAKLPPRIRMASPKLSR